MNLIMRHFNAGRNSALPKKNHLYFLVFVSLVFTSAYSNGQEITTSTPDSSLIITKDARLDELISKQREQNINNPNMHGYRIQIYFGGVRQKASEVKIEFVSRFPDVPAYLSYQQPNFKVRVGDYRNRFEAQKFLKSIEGIFPTCFIVPDEVKLPALK